MRRPVIAAVSLVVLVTFVPAGSAQPAPPDPQGASDVLRKDPRLRTPVTFNFQSPAPRDALARLHEATGVRLTLDGPMAEGQLPFGSMSIRNVPAWKVMEELAATQAVDGKWVRHGDGYALTGKPIDFRQGSTAKEASPRAGVLVLTMLSIAVGIGLLCLLFRYALRAKAQRSN